MNYLAYDVLTANSSVKGSICAVGLVLVLEGKVVYEDLSLIDPQVEFSESCTALHGITADDVRGAPTFLQYWQGKLCKFFYRVLILAHNAAFAIPATLTAMQHAGISDQGMRYTDFLYICRRLVPECPLHTLDCMAAWADKDYHPSTPLDNARAIIAVSEALKRRYDAASIERLLTRSNTGIMSSLARTAINNDRRDLKPLYRQKQFDKDKDAPVVIKDDRLYHLTVCAIGEVEGFSQTLMNRFIVSHGGRFSCRVSKNVDILVIGSPCASCSQDQINAAYASARALSDRLKIVAADDFLRLFSP